MPIHKIALFSLWISSSEGIDCEFARNEEERIMLEDANQWLNIGINDEIPHPKTGATSLHVAAAKGYIKVMKYDLLCSASHFACIWMIWII